VALADVDGVAEGESDADEWSFALDEALELAVAEAPLAAWLLGLSAWSVPFSASLVVPGDFDGAGFGVAVLEAVGVDVAVGVAVADTVGEGETEGVGEEDAAGEAGA
jgi:hypothetical protein